MTRKYANENFHDNSCRVKEKRKGSKEAENWQDQVNTFQLNKKQHQEKKHYYWNGNKTSDDSDSDVRHDALLQKEKAVKRMKTGQADSFWPNNECQWEKNNNILLLKQKQNQWRFRLRHQTWCFAAGPWEECRLLFAPGPPWLAPRRSVTQHNTASLPWIYTPLISEAWAWALMILWRDMPWSWQPWCPAAWRTRPASAHTPSSCRPAAVWPTPSGWEKKIQ